MQIKIVKWPNSIQYTTTILFYLSETSQAEIIKKRKESKRRFSNYRRVEKSRWKKTKNKVIPETKMQFHNFKSEQGIEFW